MLPGPRAGPPSRCTPFGIVNYMRAAGYAIDDIRAWGSWTSDAVFTYFRGGAQERWYPAQGAGPT